MKRTRILLIVLGLLLVLAPAGKTGLAQGVEPPVEELYEITAIVAERISYQGYLEQGGSPMNGTVDLTFTLYSDDTCTTDVETIVKTGVSVVDGYFATELDVTQDNFNGQGLWVGVETAGNDLGCQEIVPAPYALSLRPGATIEGAPGLTGHLVGASTEGGDVSGSLVQGAVLGAAAVYGSNDLPGFGVYGTSSNASGWGGYFSHTGGGTALMVAGSGIIESEAETDIAVNPLTMVVYRGSSADLRPGLSFMEVRGVSTGLHSVYVPVNLPVNLFGTQTQFERIRICYQVDTASSYIDYIAIHEPNETGGTTVIVDSNTNRTEIGWSCFYLTPASPYPLEGPLTVVFRLYFDGTGDAHDIRIGKIEVTLSE